MARLTTSLLDAISQNSPDWQAGTRPSHSAGIGVIGHFRGTPHALAFCNAPQFKTDWTPVSVRFSNSAGQEMPDPQPDVRGMAVKFHVGLDVPEASQTDADAPPVASIEAANRRESDETDLLCISTQMFMVHRAEKLLGFAAASEPREVSRRRPIERLKMLLSMMELPQNPNATLSSDESILAWSKKYRPSQPFVQTLSTLSWVWNQDEQKLVQAKPPASYARTAYHAVHAFKIVGTDGVERMVRFTFEPASGVRNEYDAQPAQDYLRNELKSRLARYPTRFNLRMYIADPWDDTTDPTVVWPTNRRRVLMGTLELIGMAGDEAGSGCEDLNYNPGRLDEQYMSMSADPVLAARVAVYNEAQRRRDPGMCPVHPAGADPA